jgi:hypothetical protein
MLEQGSERESGKRAGRWQMREDQIMKCLEATGELLTFA